MKYLIAVVFMTSMVSCSTLNYWTDYTEDVNFSEYHTYAIDDQCSDYNPGVNPINQQRIKNAIELELRSIGYSRSDNPDINIKYFIKNETKYFYEQCLPEYDNFTGGRNCIDKVYSYEEGTLVIDFIDVKNNIAVWHGGVNGEPWERMKNPDTKIRKMVKTLVKNYTDMMKTTGYAFGNK